ncbi:MAG: hypothetical protein QXL10_01060 [Candidatus Bathyarchaeia archaeon]
MILSAEEFRRILKLLKDLNESSETTIKELIDRKIAEALDQHIDDYTHKENPATEEAYPP